MDMQEGEVPSEAEIIEIDGADLRELLAVRNGAAEFVDRYGNSVRFTTEQLVKAGLTADSLEEPNISDVDEANVNGDKEVPLYPQFQLSALIIPKENEVSEVAAKDCKQ